MFEEKDYIMKIIQQFTNAVARIMGLKAENKIEESQVVLTDTLKDFTGLNTEILEALPYEILLQRVSGQTNSEKSLILAELLYQQADIYEIKGELSRAKNLYLKNANIMINVLLKGDNSVLEQNQEKVNELIEKIGRLNVSRESLLLLFHYYELTKDYAKAEDVLFELIDKSEANKDLVAKGIAFYERLLNKDQADLQKGNLPMDEVLEGLGNLKRI